MFIMIELDCRWNIVEHSINSTLNVFNNLRQQEVFMKIYSVFNAEKIF